MAAEDRIKGFLGEQLVQIAILEARCEQQAAEIASLKVQVIQLSKRTGEEKAEGPTPLP